MANTRSGEGEASGVDVLATRREVFGWQMYDWAWSAFTTTVTTALLGPYLLELAEQSGGVPIGGLRVAPASFFPFAVSASAFAQVFVLPLVGVVADHTTHKKKLMMGLAYFASAVTLGLFVITTDTVLLGGLLFVIASVAFSGASVIYNSFLCDIAPPELRDRISSIAYAYGYVGSALWLVCNFALIALMDDTELAVRISLGGTGLWCLAFMWVFPGRLLENRPAQRSKPPGSGWLSFGARSVWETIVEMRRRYPIAFRYLIAYLAFRDGMETVFTVSTSFAADELDASSELLLALVLVIQVIAIVGALFFGRLAERIGAKRSLIITLVIWSALVIYAFVSLDTIAELWVLGVGVAVVLGGSQALSRSLFSQMIPSSREAEYFGFFELVAKGTSWLGPLTFGIVNQVVGSQRSAILSLVVFFVVGLALLVPVKVRQAMLDAGQDPSRVVL
jgi:UMF1 family MFS transporter